MGKSVAKLIKADEAEGAEATQDAEATTPSEDQPKATSRAPDETGDPLERGMAHLRSLDLDPLRIWSIKGPKGIGGLVMAVFLQATSEVVMLHQMPSGRYVVFRKGEL